MYSSCVNCLVLFWKPLYSNCFPVWSATWSKLVFYPDKWQDCHINLSEYQANCTVHANSFVLQTSEYNFIYFVRLLMAEKSDGLIIYLCLFCHITICLVCSYYTGGSQPISFTDSLTFPLFFDPHCSLRESFDLVRSLQWDTEMMPQVFGKWRYGQCSSVNLVSRSELIGSM